MRPRGENGRAPPPPPTPLLGRLPARPQDELVGKFGMSGQTAPRFLPGLPPAEGPGLFTGQRLAWPCLCFGTCCADCSYLPTCLLSCELFKAGGSVFVVSDSSVLSCTFCF